MAAPILSVSHTLSNPICNSPDLGRRDTEPGGVSEKFFRPVFRKTPEDKECQEGQMVRFDCIVTGRPHPELFWYRDGVQVCRSVHFSLGSGEEVLVCTFLGVVNMFSC